MATNVDLLESVRLTRSCWGSSWEHLPRYRRHTWGHHADSFWQGCWLVDSQEAAGSWRQVCVCECRCRRKDDPVKKIHTGTKAKGLCNTQSCDLELKGLGRKMAETHLCNISEMHFLLQWRPLVTMQANKTCWVRMTEIQIKVIIIFINKLIFRHCHRLHHSCLLCQCCVTEPVKEGCSKLTYQLLCMQLTWSILSGLASIPGGMCAGEKAICSISAK